MGSGASSSGRGADYLAMFSKDSETGNALGSSWTREEQAENAKAVKLYERLSAFAYNHYFSGVKVRQGRKGIDPQAPLWIEPSPEFYTPELSELVEQSKTSPYLGAMAVSASSSPSKTSADREIQAILKVANTLNPDQIFNSEREKYLKAIPSGVLLKCDGNIKVIFTLTGAEYEYVSADVDKYDAMKQLGKKTLRMPQPPLAKVLPVNYLFPEVSIKDEAVKKSKFRSILLSWSNRLPLPLGLVHQIEVQYCIAQAMHPVVVKFQKARDDLYEGGNSFSLDSIAAASIHDSINEKAVAACKADFLLGDSGDGDDTKSNANANSTNSSGALWKPWSTLATKALEYPDFGSFTAEQALPGAIYSYRVRYRCAAEWSSYSSRSAPIAIPPAPPEAPGLLKYSFVTAVATMISWAAPSSTNGCKIKEYVLYCRAVEETAAANTGDLGGLLDDKTTSAAVATASSQYSSDYREVYRGPDTKFLVTGLSPQTAYGFTITTVTFAGESKQYEPHLHIITSPLVAFRHLRALLRGGGKKKKQEEESNPILDIINGVDEGDVSNSGQEVLGVGFSSNPHLAKEQFDFAMSCRPAWRVCYDAGSQTQFYFNIITSVRTRDIPDVLKVQQHQTHHGEHHHHQLQQQQQQQQSSSHQSNHRQSDSAYDNSVTLAHTSDEGFDQRFRSKRFHLYSKLRNHLLAIAKSANRMHRFNLDKSPSKGKKSSASAAQGSSSPLSPLSRMHAADGGESEGWDTNGMFVEPPRLAFDEDLFLNEGNDSSSNNNGSSDESDINRSREGILIVNLRRSALLFDAYHCFMRLSWSDMTRKLKVVFDGESGIDSGGLGREAFLLISRQITQFSGKFLKSWLISLDNKAFGSSSDSSASSSSGIRAVSDVGMGTYFVSCDHGGPGPNASPASTSGNSKAQGKPSAPLPSFVDKDENQLSSASIKALDDMNVSKTSFLFFIGVFMGKALLDGQIIDLRWSYLIYQHIISGLAANTVISKVDNESYKVFDVNWPICKSDLELLLSSLNSMDAQLAASLLWMVDNDITGVIDENFTVLVANEAIDLCPNGANIAVTNANKLHYVRLICTWRTQYSIQESLQALLEGFHGLVPLDIITHEGITPRELLLILNGKPSIDVHEVRAYCTCQSVGNVAFNETRKIEVSFNEEHFLVRFFFKILEEVSPELQRSIIKFITGTACSPNDGYDPPFCITYGAGTMADDSLPRSHTCFHQVVLPHYTSYAKMKERLIFAAENTVGFELM